MEFRDIAFRNRLLAAGIIGFFVISVPWAQAADLCKSAISEEASAALLRMGQTLRAEQFSFQARTISVNVEAAACHFIFSTQLESPCADRTGCSLR